MSEVRLVVREAERDWSGTVHGSMAERAIAALSADPVTLAELETACGRYARPAPARRLFANLAAASCADPYDAGLVVLDLVARLVVVDSTYSTPGPTGGVAYHDGAGETDTLLPYHLADDWLLTSDGQQWQAVAEKRRRQRADRPLLDARGVFYGRPLLEFIARQTFAAFMRRPTTPAEAERTDEQITYDTLKDIHAAWLLTPRDDLGGTCPRDLALEQHSHLGWDLQDQCERWSLLGQSPPGLAASSFAFRQGGFGTHELVKYYDLVRALLWSCWGRLGELAQTPAGHGTVADFLGGEVARLESVRDQWLDAPDPECHGRTPRSIIDRERARLPEGMSGHDAMVDADCPCCQMMADLPGPVFWHLDGSAMDDDFAFDIRHRSRAEWEEERRSWEEHSRRFNAEWEERKRLGVADSGGKGSVWSSSFAVGDAADVPLGIRLFGIGAHLAELITDLRGGSAAAQGFIDQLNRDFGNLREVLQPAEPALGEALLQPVLDRFVDSLAAVAAAHPDLSAKCASLTDSLGRFLEPAPAASIEDDDDSDSPFD